MMATRLLAGSRPQIQFGLFRRQGPIRQRHLRVQSLMLPYQYQARAEKLRKKGFDVVEFGERTMREGCFGEDVLQLQNFLSEEDYYNPVNGGYTGYFGAVTKDALQAWQADQGLEANGVFDSKCKWAYLRQQEFRASQAGKKQASPVVATPAPAPAPVAPKKQASVAVTTPTPVVAAKSSGFNPAGFILAGAAAFATYQLFIRGNIMGILLAKTASFAGSSPSPAGSQSTTEPSLTQAELDTAAAAADLDDSHESRLRRLSEDELQRYIGPMKGGAPSKTPLQRPRPLRPSSSSSTSSSTNRSSSGNDPFLTSKYGNYYGGKEVIERVKQSLAEETGASLDAANAAARRLAALSSLAAQQQRQRALTAENEAVSTDGSNGSNASGGDSNKAEGASKQLSPKASTPTPSASPSGSPSSSFEDVATTPEPETAAATPPAAAAEPVSAKQQINVRQQAAPVALSSAELLAGTDLEKSPIERPVIRPVRVQRPARLMSSMDMDIASTSSSSNGSTTNNTTSNRTAAAAPASRPRPVPVVKPNQMAATIGEAMEQAGVDADSLSTGVSISMDETVVLEDRPIKIHKPARLVSGARAVPRGQWESTQSYGDE